MTSKKNDDFLNQEFMWVNFLVNVKTHFSDKFLTQERRNIYHFIAASSLVQLHDDLDFAKTLNKGHAICDSRIIEILSRVRGVKIERIRGADFVRLFFTKITVTKKHLFVGSTPQVMKSLIANINLMSRRHQEIHFICPEFDVQMGSQTREIVKELTARDFDYIWVAMGSPKQDYMAHAIRADFDGSIFCIGAAVDFVSGHKSEAPSFFQFIGIEWLYRFAQEPRRLFIRYTFGNIRFISLFCKWAFEVRFSKSEALEVRDDVA